MLPLYDKWLNILTIMQNYRFQTLSLLWLGLVRLVTETSAFTLHYFIYYLLQIDITIVKCIVLCIKSVYENFQLVCISFFMLFICRREFQNFNQQRLYAVFNLMTLVANAM